MKAVQTYTVEDIPTHLHHAVLLSKTETRNYRQPPRRCPCLSDSHSELLGDLRRHVWVLKIRKSRSSRDHLSFLSTFIAVELGNTDAELNWVLKWSNGCSEGGFRDNELIQLYRMLHAHGSRKMVSVGWEGRSGPVNLEKPINANLNSEEGFFLLRFIIDFQLMRWNKHLTSWFSFYF